MIEFALPWSALLLPLPWLLRRVLPPAPDRSAPLYFPLAVRELDLAGSRARGAGVPARRLRLLAMLITWLALVLAACGPRWIGDAEAIPGSGRDLMLAVDISESMKTPDMEIGGQRVDRLVAVKAVAREFLRRRSGDRLGLILFGSNAYLHAPLTFDHATVERLLMEARIGFAGQNTAIGDALGIAVKRLRDRPASGRVLILLTDGANTAGEISPLQAAQLAAQAGLRIHTIGIGAESMQVPGLFGNLFGGRTVNPSADLDEATLRSIAGQTRGRYFRARDPAELEQAYREIDRLEPVAQDAAYYRPMISLHGWPLGLALVLAGLVAGNALDWRALLRRRAPADAGP